MAAASCEGVRKNFFLFFYLLVQICAVFVCASALFLVMTDPHPKTMNAPPRVLPQEQQQFCPPPKEESLDSGGVEEEGEDNIRVVLDQQCYCRSVCLAYY